MIRTPGQAQDEAMHGRCPTCGSDDSAERYLVYLFGKDIDGTVCENEEFHRVKHPCPECGGSGELEWTDTGSDHGPNCDGYTCREPCPVPVPIQRIEPCATCNTTGEVDG